MIYVVVAELIPELHEHEYSDLGTLFFSLGFVIMMILDVALSLSCHLLDRPFFRAVCIIIPLSIHNSLMITGQLQIPSHN